MLSLHDWYLIGYTVDGIARTLTLRVESPSRDRTLEVRFKELVAYHLEGDCLQNIIFDVQEVAPEAVVGNEDVFRERHRRLGWPSGWDSTKESAVAFLAEQGASTFLLSSSYGMEGWIAAADAEIL